MSDYDTKEDLESIREQIVSVFLPGKNETLAEGVAIKYANLRRDFYAQENKPLRKTEWHEAIESAQENSYIKLKKLIKRDANDLLSDYTPEFFDEKEREGIALIYLADSLPMFHSSS